MGVGGCCGRPTKIPCVCELCGGEGGVSAVVGEVFSVKFGCGEEAIMPGGMVEGS
jgi:hypothetical protein